MISRFQGSRGYCSQITSSRKIFKLQEEKQVYQKIIIANAVLVILIGIVAYLAFNNRTERACSNDSDSKNTNNSSIIQGTVMHQNKTP